MVTKSILRKTTAVNDDSLVFLNYKNALPNVFEYSAAMISVFVDTAIVGLDCSEEQ